MRILIALAMFSIAATLVLFAVLTLADPLWGEYEDSASATLILVATVEAALALGLAGLGVWVLRGR
jgi:hypothetical protein